MSAASFRNVPYFSNGQALASPPITARLNSFANSAYAFVGLYLVTLFSFDSAAAAEASSFNPRNKNNTTSSRKPGFGGSSGGGGSGGGGSGYGPGGGGSGRKMGSVDDVRGPECKSCQ